MTARLIAKTLSVGAVIVGVLLLAPNGVQAVGLGKTCGGFPNVQCDKELFCEKPTGICFFADMSGTCKRKPIACTAQYLPVCGCDNKTYSNDCVRRSAGVSKKHDGAC